MFFRPGQNRISLTLSFGRGLCAVFSLAGALLLSSPASAGNKFVEEVTCLALNIYFEARNQPAEGKIAVGHVVMNRVAHRRFPKSICRVIRQGGFKRRHRCQFSWWCDGQSDKPRDRAAWTESRRVAAAIYMGASDDPTDGALWYHADYVKPDWRNDFHRGPKIGRHVFYAIDSMKRKRTEATDPSPQYVAVVPVSYKIINRDLEKRPEIRTANLTEQLLMVFGIGLIGLGFAGFHRKRG